MRIKHWLLFFSAFFLFGSCNVTKQKQQTFKYSYYDEGDASWYGKEFSGRKTASGETFNPDYLTAAHRTLEFGTYVRVTNLKNKKSVIVKINDRGPVKKTRIIDLSERAAKEIDMINDGVVRVKLELVKIVYE
jgi:rare lipoprotein A